MFSFPYLYKFFIGHYNCSSQSETYSKGVAFKSSSLYLSLWICWSHHYLPSFTPSKNPQQHSKTKSHFLKTETNKKSSTIEMYPTRPHYWRRRLSINRPQAFLLLILCLFFIHHCDASRFSSSSVFYRNPNYDHSNNTVRRGHFLGFLPRHLPVPASAPSRKHNDIGIQALLSPWSLSLSRYIVLYLYLMHALIHKEYKTIHRSPMFALTWN